MSSSVIKLIIGAVEVKDNQNKKALKSAIYDAYDKYATQAERDELARLVAEFQALVIRASPIVSRCIRASRDTEAAVEAPNLNVKRTTDRVRKSLMATHGENTEAYGETLVNTIKSTENRESYGDCVINRRDQDLRFKTATLVGMHMDLIKIFSYHATYKANDEDASAAFERILDGLISDLLNYDQEELISTYMSSMTDNKMYVKEVKSAIIKFNQEKKEGFSKTQRRGLANIAI
jgi:hypothetical protein